MNRYVCLVLCITPAWLGGCQGAFMNTNDAPESTATTYVQENFLLDTLGEAWVPRTPELWSIVQDAPDRRVLTMAPPPERPMLPGVRRPQEYVTYARQSFQSFNFSCRVRVDNEPAVKGRDACILFGIRDATHFYYIHLSNESVDWHNCLVRVDGDTRTKLAQPTKAPMTDRNWHKVDLIRNVETGAITVYVDAYDASARPWLEANDTTYTSGRIGLGSFNDHASFARILIEGQVE